MDRRLAVVLVLVLLSRLLLLAESPFEVDSVLLARAVEDFDPTQMRPHPPGYAGLVGVAKLFPFDAGLSLRVVSAVAAVPLVWAVWAIARRLGGDPLVAATLVAANPVLWFYGLHENAYAAGAAGAACTAWAALVARDREGPRAAWLVGVALGVTGALRPSLLVFLAPVAAYGVGYKRLHHLALAAAVPTLAWIGASAWASGGLGEFLGSVLHQFTWIREGHPDHWRLHQVHHLAVYAAQAIGGGLLLLPWVRRLGDWKLLVLWAGVPFVFHLAVYVAKAGYLVPYLPAVAIVASLAAAPRALKIAAPMLSAAFFLFAQPVDVEADRTPKRAFADKTWSERIRSEISFISTSSLARLRNQDRVNEGYADLLGSHAKPGRTTVIWVDRWDAAICEDLVPGVKVVDLRTPKLEIPVEGRRIVVLAWDSPGDGFSEVESPEGYGAWVRDLSLEELPTQIFSIEAVPVY